MDETKIVTLLPGPVFKPGNRQKILVMGDYAHLVPNSDVELHDAHGNSAGTATVLKAHSAVFAFLGKADFDGQADPQLGSYANALHRLQTLMPDFSIMDQVTVVDVVVHGS